MTSIDILFETNRFNVSEVKQNFLNSCCFGEDFAEWLRQRLVERGVTVSMPGQEDWGWYLSAAEALQHYFLGLSGYLGESAVGKDDGEWRVIVKKERSVWDRLRGKNKITDSDPMVAILEKILCEQTDVRNIRREKNG